MSLDCPDDDNYAAIAKQLHETALEAEARIYDLEQQLRFAVNGPTIIQTSTAAITGLAANVENPIGPTQTTTTRNFDNTTLLSELYIDEAGLFEQLGAGLYEIGMFANVIASGAVDDNTWRSFRIVHERPDPTVAGGWAILDESSYTMFESNTGTGTDVCLVAHFSMREEDRVSFLFFHLNTSSTMNASSNNMFWLHKLSLADTLRII